MADTPDQSTHDEDSGTAAQAARPQGPLRPGDRPGRTRPRLLGRRSRGGLPRSEDAEAAERQDGKR